MCLLQDCARPLSIEADENGCFPLDGKILCMKCHTQRAKQAAHWPRYDTHPVQKHRIHSATGFLPLQQQLCSVEICRRECERAEKKCLHAGKVSPTPVPPPLVFVRFSAEVMYCTEGPKKKKRKKSRLFQTLQRQPSLWTIAYIFLWKQCLLLNCQQNLHKNSLMEKKNKNKKNKVKSCLSLFRHSSVVSSTACWAVFIRNRGDDAHVERRCSRRCLTLQWKPFHTRRPPWLCRHSALSQHFLSAWFTVLALKSASYQLLCSRSFVESLGLNADREKKTTIDKSSRCCSWFLLMWICALIIVENYRYFPSLTVWKQIKTEINRVFLTVD